MTWRWLNRQALLAAHDEQLAEHGGATGVRDEGLFDSALARPENLAAYGTPDVFALAAAYGFGLARNHPFVDGNKRVAAIATETFLALNGMALEVDDAAFVMTFLSLAAGEMDEDALADWLRRHGTPL
ncbi:MAG: type II toxin-antitoxin system death-on-curing family toxin [Micropepsaceae bacterium]